MIVAHRRHVSFEPADLRIGISTQALCSPWASRCAMMSPLDNGVPQKKWPRYQLRRADIGDRLPVLEKLRERNHCELRFALCTAAAPLHTPVRRNVCNQQRTSSPSFSRHFIARPRRFAINPSGEVHVDSHFNCGSRAKLPTSRSTITEWGRSRALLVNQLAREASTALTSASEPPRECNATSAW